MQVLAVIAAFSKAGAGALAAAGHRRCGAPAVPNGSSSSYCLNDGSFGTWGMNPPVEMRMSSSQTWNG